LRQPEAKRKERRIANRAAVFDGRILIRCFFIFDRAMAMDQVFNKDDDARGWKGATSGLRRVKQNLNGTF